MTVEGRDGTGPEEGAQTQTDNLILMKASQ